MLQCVLPHKDKRKYIVFAKKPEDIGIEAVSSSVPSLVLSTKASQEYSFVIYSSAVLLLFFI
jgi:hypothetical protein